MKNFPFRIRCIFSLLCIFVGLGSPLSTAASPFTITCDRCTVPVLERILAAINSMSDAVTSRIDKTGQAFEAYMQKNFILSNNPYQPGAKLGNVVNSKEVASDAYTANQELSMKSMQVLASLTDPVKIINQYGNLCGSDYDKNMGNPNCKNNNGSIFFPSENHKEKLSATDANIDASTLLNLNLSASDQQDAAKNFIGFLSSMNIPITPIPSRAALEKLGPESSQLERYRNVVRTFLSAQSVAINNLFYIYSRHVTVAGAGTSAGLSDYQNISADELDRQLALRRVGSQSWYDDMQKATPPVIAHETLFTLAEMRYEMHQNLMIQERILLTESALLATFLQQTRENISQLESSISSSIQQQQ